MVCIINFTFSRQECLKSHFRASKFQNFLWEACPQTPLEQVAFSLLNSHSRLLLYGQMPTSNLIESPARDMCFPGGRTHITKNMCFPGRGTHITREMCLPGEGTHITRDMCFPGGGHISLGICISHLGNTYH